MPSAMTLDEFQAQIRSSPFPIVTYERSDKGIIFREFLSFEECYKINIICIFYATNTTMFYVAKFF